MSVEFTFTKRFLERLQQVFDEKAKSIHEGKAASFDDYRYRCGVIQGYQDARKIALALEREVLGKPPLK